jgi:hypothetical protein
MEIAFEEKKNGRIGNGKNGNEWEMTARETELIRSDGKTPLSRPINRPPPRLQTFRRRWNGSHQLEGLEEGS